ncbi:hypothetical protein [Bradyrhizobium sp. 187]|uniref:hypothetical protein n=1 Tax=Bradyrhizobium sp. 187 TaxID=2782655 RepID=UPI001FFEAA68|nr:hypothetical protein [Bradyrhizobium sp. 187]UPJ72022.1 hypothetical protein IVB19_31370 [Bradyrhizobium sp. 187]
MSPGESVTVQGITIAAGRFYLGQALLSEDQEIDGYVVNPKLSARMSRPDAPEIPCRTGRPTRT